MAIALYARKSVERESSISCETQIEYCRTKIMPDEKAEPVITFIDNGCSGATIEREEFKRMLRQIETGNITKVIVYRLDRIGRSLSDFLRILDILKKNNVQFISSQESFDTNSPYGEMIVKLLMVFAEFERQSSIERVTQAYAHRSEKGFYMGGRRPYGFTFIDTQIGGIKTKMFSPVENEAEQIKYLYKEYSVGNVSLRKLRDNLIENNILPTMGNWSTAKISAILRNPIYVKADNAVFQYYSEHSAKIVSDITEFDGVHGVQLYGKTTHTAIDWSDMKVVIMPHEGVIDSKTWLKCQQRLEKNKQIGNAMSNTTSWLGGKVACKKCGRIMNITRGSVKLSGTQQRYFNCTGKSHNRICTGISRTVYAESIEKMVCDLIAEKLLSFRFYKAKAENKNLPEINRLRNRISEIRLQQDKLVDAITNGLVGEDMMQLLNDRAKEYAKEIDDIYKGLDELERGNPKTINMMKVIRKWRGATFEERRAVCSTLINRIYIDEESVEVVWNI